MDTQKRMAYKKTIAEISETAVARVRQARVANDLPAARAAAYEASSARNAARQATRQSLSWGGAKISEAIDKSLTPAEYFQHHGKEISDPFDVAEKVALKSGAGRRTLNGLVILGKVASPLAIGYGVYSAQDSIRNAPPDLRYQVATQEAGGVLGGASGATLGTGLAVIGVGALVTTPPGWLVLGAGLIGGGVAGYGGSELGRTMGGKIYQWWKR
jgi:hypothetical protein